jgi:predicted ATP-dependent endonuclease of OLD family
MVEIDSPINHRNPFGNLTDHEHISCFLPSETENEIYKAIQDGYRLICLMGPEASGKSTVLRTLKLCCNEQVSNGQMVIVDEFQTLSIFDRLSLYKKAPLLIFTLHNKNAIIEYLVYKNKLKVIEVEPMTKNKINDILQLRNSKLNKLNSEESAILMSPQKLKPLIDSFGNVRDVMRVLYDQYYNLESEYNEKSR